MILAKKIKKGKKTMKNFNMNNICGIDASIQISLFEYGFAWILSSDKSEYKFYYSVSGHCNNSVFDFSFQPADLNVKSEVDWIEDWTQIFNYAGMTESEFFSRELPYVLYDLLQYYGYENVFGSAYNGYKYLSNIKRFKNIY